MQDRSRAGVVALVAVVALLAAACGGGIAEVTLAELTTDQEGYDGRFVRVEGIVRAFEDPPHAWIEDAELNRVELQPLGSVEPHVGERIRVEGRFTFRDDEGRRIVVEDLEVLDAAPGA